MKNVWRAAIYGAVAVVISNIIRHYYGKKGSWVFILALGSCAIVRVVFTVRKEAKIRAIFGALSEEEKSQIFGSDVALDTDELAKRLRKLEKQDSNKVPEPTRFARGSS
jgi:D-arabinose 1-dehydrogenase-like Zn-dependent alcohol dehydrogenase